MRYAERQILTERQNERNKERERFYMQHSKIAWIKSKSKHFWHSCEESFVANVLIMNAVLWNGTNEICQQSQKRCHSNDDDNCDGKDN